MKNIFILFLYFSYIKCYCKGSHNRKDLSKKECAKYEIEKEEVSGDNPENYECCFMESLIWNDLLHNECLIISKDKKTKILYQALEATPLNIFDMKTECSFNSLNSKLFNIIVLLLILF